MIIVCDYLNSPHDAYIKNQIISTVVYIIRLCNKQEWKALVVYIDVLVS